LRQEFKDFDVRIPAPIGIRVGRAMIAGLLGHVELRHPVGRQPGVTVKVWAQVRDAKPCSELLPQLLASLSKALGPAQELRPPGEHRGRTALWDVGGTVLAGCLETPLAGGRRLVQISASRFHPDEERLKKMRWEEIVGPSEGSGSGVLVIP